MTAVGFARGLTDQRGQALIVTAFAMVGLFAFLALVVDAGWGLYQRRLAQNAADAAALSAIQSIANLTTSTTTACVDATLVSTVSSLITDYTTLNAGSAATVSYSFINNTGGTISSSQCTTGTGVRVTVTAPYNTFFLNLVGISSSQAVGVAGGRVRVLSSFMGAPPFIACGNEMMPVSGGGSVNILDTTTNPPSVKEQYVNTEFYLKGNEVKNTCGTGSNWKGLADDTATGCTSLPCDVTYTTGNHSGPTRVKVAGATAGCDGTTWNGCVLILPVADGLGSSGNSLHSVTWAAFNVTEVDANTHKGILLGAVFTTGASSDWSPGASGLLVLSLTE